MKPTQTALSHKLRELRDQRGLSVGAAAERAGIAKSTLSTWERGTRSPRAIELRALLDFFKVSPEERARLLSPNANQRDWNALDLPAQMAPSTAIADALRGLRLRKHLSQGQLAAMIGVSQVALSKWESGSTEPSSSNLAAFGRSVDLDEEEQALLRQTQVDGSIPLWRTLWESSSPREPDEFFPSYFLIDEHAETLTLLSALHAVRRRAALDEAWHDSLLQFAERYCRVLMQTQRNREMGEICRSLHPFLEKAQEKGGAQRLLIMEVLAEHRIRKNMPENQASRLVRLASDWHKDAAAWAYATAAGIFHDNGNALDCRFCISHLVEHMESVEGTLGGSLAIASGYLNDAGFSREALYVFERYWDKHWQGADDRNPYELLALTSGAKIYKSLGDEQQGTSLLDLADRRLLDCDYSLQPAASESVRATIEETRRKFAL